MSEQFGLWLPAVLLFGTVTLATVALALAVEWAAGLRERRAVARQLQAFAGAGAVDAAPASALRGAVEPPPAWFNTLASHVPQLRGLAALLDRAGVAWTPQTFLILTLGSALGAALTVNVLTRFSAAAALAALGAGALPYAFIRHRRQRRLAAFEEQLPEAIDLIGRAMRAGHPLSAGLKMVGEEAPEPLASEFRRVFEEQRFGMPFDEAVVGLADRLELTDVHIFVTAVLVQREVGGNLAEVLDKIAHTIRQRFVIRRQLRVYTAQGRFSGYVLSALPIAVASALYFINREYTMTLFVDPIARYFLILAVILQVVGYLWIRKIVNIPI